ncbi:hypothetical protein DPX16_11231 [Anabarilius grahami]|uniref:Uncharacterized protein n=1 Tax=Anabarilius grahami TaxID=495550 RepID=A0A3N0Y3G7_ANAGA|nr:hypothetical protein DPX16_11231 [Anabarilius grahami]
MLFVEEFEEGQWALLRNATHPAAAEMAGNCSRGDGTSGRVLRVEEHVVTDPSICVYVIREQQ